MRFKHAQETKDSEVRVFEELRKEAPGTLCVPTRRGSSAPRSCSVHHRLPSMVRTKEHFTASKLVLSGHTQ